MDPPPPSLLHPITIPATTSQHLYHPDSANSSPRSRQDTTWDDHNHQPLASIPGGAAKLRLMCSYGGHIIPRPHDKSLCYVGGETRIVVVDRQSSLEDLHSRLSQTLLNGRHFTLKYQLPTEELDSLISMATEEDMENMIEEYDRSSCGASPLKPSRLRLFLFPSKPETAASMGSLLDDAKSETWFVDALNGSGLLPRGLSESAAIDNNLLELEHSIMNNVDSSPNLDPDPIDQSNKQVVMESSPVGITVEMNSSFGSSSSSPSTANPPPIKVRVENQQIIGLDEQLSQMNLQNAAAAVTATAALPVNDVNKSDPGAAPHSALRKPPLPLQPVQRKFVDIHNLSSPDSKRAGATYNLPSPDSVASDSSIASGGSSLSKNSMYQDATQIANPENRVPTPVDQKMINNNNNITQDPNSQIPIQQQMTDHPLQISPQQQFIHQNPNNTHYIPSYYPMYLPQQPQQQSFQHQQTDPNTHYAMYLFPPQAHSQTGYDTSSAGPVQQIYQTKPEMAQNMYSTATGPTTPTPTPMLYHQVPAHQFQQQQQQQYMALSQIPSQPQTGNANYGYEYSQANQDQMYYAQAQQHQAIPPPQYQTISPAAVAAMMSQASPPQLPTDNNSAQQL